jgi:periplasmic protein TonB
MRMQLRSSRQINRVVSAAGALLFQAAMIWTLLNLGSAGEPVAEQPPVARLLSFPVEPPAPPPPPPPPVRLSSTGRPKEAPAPPNRRATPTPVVAPPPVIPVPVPANAAPVPATGADTRAGAAEVDGPGTGYSGRGNGLGGGGRGGTGGGNGLGDGTPPRWRRGAVKDSDYPPRAAEAGISGTVSVIYRVGVDGRASDCSVTASSGNVELDEATCRVIERRFRFAPARDADGRPVSSRIVENHSWVIERDKSPNN